MFERAEILTKSPDLSEKLDFFKMVHLISVFAWPVDKELLMFEPIIPRQEMLEENMQEFLLVCPHPSVYLWGCLWSLVEKMPSPGRAATIPPDK